MLGALAAMIVAVAAGTGEFRVNTDRGAVYQGYSACATGADGSFAVVWEDGRSGGNDIYIQRFDPAGERRGGNVPVNSAISAEQFAPAISTDPAGTYWVVWQDFRVSGYPINGDILLQRVSASGVFLDTNWLVNDDAAVLTQKDPSIAIGGSGALVVWTDLRRGEWDVYAQYFDLSGRPVGNNFLLNDEIGPAPQHSSRVCALPDGRFVVVWYDSRNGNEDVYGQIVSSGAPTGANFQVNSGVDGKKQWFPTVAQGPADGFTVAWEDYRGGVYPAGSKVYAQAFDRDGGLLGGNFAVSESGHDQRKPRITGDVAGNRAVTWEEDRDGRWMIFQRKYLTGVDSGLTASIVGSDSVAGSRARPQVAIGAGQVFYTWTDNRDGDFDIYMQIESYRFPTFLPSPASISFVAPWRGLDAAAPETVAVEGVGGAALLIGWSGLPSWLTVGPLTAVTPTEYVFRLVPPVPARDTGFTIFATDQTDTAAEEPVSVILDLIEPVLAASPSAVEFSYATGPETAWVAISNAEIGPLEWSFVAPAADWNVTRITGDSLAVIFDATGRPDSSWFDTVWVSDSLAVNSPLAIPLRADVGGIPPSPAYLIVTPNVARWIADSGAARRDSVVVMIGANKDTAIAWSIDVVPEWLSVEPRNGIIPDTVVLRAAVDALSVGTYADTLMVWSPDASNAPLELPVELLVDVVSGIGDEPAVRPEKSVIVYPNPFNSSVLIELEGYANELSQAHLEVFDVLGRRVAGSRGDGVDRVSGSAFRWTPSRARSSGIYFVRVAAGGGTFVRRVVYLK